MSAATTDEPSTPVHTPISKGTPTEDPQVSFCVEKLLRPQWAAIDGSA